MGAAVLKYSFRIFAAVIIFSVFLTACSGPEYAVIIRNGLIYDGSGGAPVAADVGINADTIAFIGDLKNTKGNTEIDAHGLAVAPGFINMLSWATESLLMDGRSQSDIRQGVTLEVMGEGTSMGPLNKAMKADEQRESKRLGQNIDYNWNTLGEYLKELERKGVSTNVASFVGATTVRAHVLGLENRSPYPEELEEMRALVRQAMEEGALGVGSSLIYTPGSFATTQELIELCKVASRYDGMYITHMRSEGNDILTALNETIAIAAAAGLPAEIYHLKLAGNENWNKLDTVIARIAKANKNGVKITADMYTYAAGATGLDAAMPTWLQEGGVNEWIRRMKEPASRKKALKEMSEAPHGWENLMRLAGSPDRILLVSFKNDSLKRFTGKTLLEVSKLYGKSPEETAMDLVITDSSRVGTVYFMMSEENIRRQLALPYVSIGSDASSLAPEGWFLKSNVHPRAYGNFSRLLAKYVRDEKVLSVADAIRRMTSLPADNLKIKKRGRLVVGNYADVVVFSPDKIQDHAAFEKPHQYSTGMEHVLVNGVAVLRQGEHTGAKPGRVVRGPGYQRKITQVDEMP